MDEYLISSDQEDFLYFLLEGDVRDDEDADTYDPPEFEALSSQDTLSTSTQSTTDSLGHDIYWKDDNTEDTEDPDPRTTPFRPRRQPGFQTTNFTRFFGIIVYMSVAKFSGIEKYWSASVLYRQCPVKDVMTKRRFQAILCFIQVTPPVDIDKDNSSLIQDIMDDGHTILSYHFRQLQGDVGFLEQ